MYLIDPELWKRTRAGARAGRGFRFQDAVAAWLALEGWAGTVPWEIVIPEGADDLSLHGKGLEIRAQLKSRHDPKAHFTLVELAQYIAKAAENLPTINDGHSVRLAIILERPVAGLDPTGWDRTLEGVGLTEALATEMLKATQPTSEGARSVLSRTHLLVEPHPVERALPHLKAAALLPALAQLAFQVLRQSAGAAADANFLAPANAAHVLGATMVQQHVDEIKQLADPLGYLTLTHGLCEVADFDTPLSRSDFYQGVNVAPGHIGAGLVFERPELTTDLLEALERRHAALIAGPSGAGKSALAWLAAFHSRHAVRWYRLRRVGRDDVARIIGMSKLLDARAERPIGFVVDDVAHEDMAGFDRLAVECVSMAGILLIGTVREEDLFRLDTGTLLPIVRPKLNEALALRLWQELSRDDASKFSFWREPFEMSQGLLLEYTHLLTEGRRLYDTLEQQVRRRLNERRHDELTVLRTVAFAAAHGGAVDQQRLLTALGWDRPRLAEALSRLLDEHTIRETGGRLLGLHDIRSMHLDNRLRELMMVPVEEQLSQAVQVLVPAHFSPFIVKVLRRWPESVKAMQEALAARIGEGAPDCWVPILHGLGLATANLIAARWVDISRKAGIEDRFASLALTFALTGVTFGGNPNYERLTAAILKFAEINVEDLRWPVVTHIKNLEAALEYSLDDYHRLVAVLLPLHGSTAPPPLTFGLKNDLSEVPLTEYLDVALAVRELRLDLALDFIEMGGGTAKLLDRLYHEQPWVTRPILKEVDGITVVEGHVLFMPKDVQPDTNGAVVRYCELMMAAAPSASRVICSALGPDGAPAGMGDFKIATKDMPRKSLVVPARVAWNRAQLRAAQHLVGAPQHTERIRKLTQLINDSAERLNQAAEFYCRMEQPGRAWSMQVYARGLINSMIPPQGVNEATGDPLAGGTYDVDDDINRFTSNIQHLIEQLAGAKIDRPGLAASNAAKLIEDAGKLLDSDLWRFAAAPPLDAIRTLRATLLNLRAVFGDHDTDPRRHASSALRLARSSRSRPTLERAAMEAREHAEKLLAERRGQVEASFRARGLEVKIFSRTPDKDDGNHWPNYELAGLLVTTSLIEWVKSQVPVVDAIGQFEDLPTFSYAPLIHGYIAPIAVQCKRVLSPYSHFARDWGAHVPFPVLDDEAVNCYVAALNALNNLSTVFSNLNRERNNVEEQYTLAQFGQFREATARLKSLSNRKPDEVLEGAVSFIAGAGQRVAKESMRQGDGPSVAEQLYGVLSGRPSQFFVELQTYRIALAKRAVDIMSPRIACSPG
jgi:hypothetical protein